MNNQDTIYTACGEALAVLALCEKNLLNKIPNEIIKELASYAAESNKEILINPSETLINQKISEQGKDIIALLYYNYIADENEKVELKKMFDENEKTHQKENQTNYTFNTKFDENTNEDFWEAEDFIPNNSLEEYKESFLQKLIKFILKLLHIN